MPTPLRSLQADYEGQVWRNCLPERTAFGTGGVDLPTGPKGILSGQAGARAAIGILFFLFNQSKNAQMAELPARTYRRSVRAG